MHLGIRTAGEAHLASTGGTRYICPTVALAFSKCGQPPTKTGETVSPTNSAGSAARRSRRNQIGCHQLPAISSLRIPDSSDCVRFSQQQSNFEM
ncbi:hypothetical protein CDAR_465761 [Caerostris darwini]|uniref:Uncharacterized protein n=1 Tax=Caerostris darwini TaxID=1538125 RepID=A0AAV4V1D0_9ARAC|nr:hypothetical protein CDAR_465761 [Caerostris darwini]